MTSTSYPADAKDWRGVFIKHLVGGLARRPDIQLDVWAPPGELPDNVGYAATHQEREWLTALMAAGGIAHLMRNGGWKTRLAPIQLLRWLHATYRRPPLPDLYHVNWLQNALVLPANGRPVLVSVLGTDMQLMKLPGMVRLLKRRFRDRPTAICPNAEWMLPQLREWFGDIASVVYVPFGIEERWFQLQRVPQEEHRWLCVSRVTQGKIGSLFDWCEPYFAGQARQLHLLGPMQQSMQIPDWVHYHGAANPDTLSKDWFPGACGLITLSRHAEGRPQVMLEAMASGLPIVASAIPAHSDLLRHRETGWLCQDPGDVEAGLRAIEDPLSGPELALRAKAWVQSHVGTWDDCANRYASVYHQLLGKAQ
jgi:glycosyltransferase involved in cell wall biosynthesis